MKQICKRLGFGLLAVASFLGVALAAFPASVAAAGETYTWKDYNTLTMSGGDIKKPVEFKLIANSNPQRFVPADASRPTDKAGCDLDAAVITLNSDSSANFDNETWSEVQNEGTVARPAGVTWCWSQEEDCTLGIFNCHKKFDGIPEKYNHGITIGGTRPGSDQQSETDLDRRVSVIINSPNPNSSSADTITITIKDAAGKVVSTAQAKKEAALGNTDPNSDHYVDPQFQPVYYLNDFELDPGKYTVCATIVIADCKAFTKEKFKTLILEYGDDSTKRQINVRVIASYIGGVQNMTVGPFEVTLRKPSGEIVTQQTNTQSHKMTPEEEQVQGGVTVTYELSTYTTFNGLDPATYEICVTGVEDCQDVVKPAGDSVDVVFKLDWNAFNADTTYERDCKDKYEVMGVKAITFLVCSVIDTGTYAVGTLDNVIGNLLTVDTKDVFDDSSANNPYHIAWNSFRAFALGLIVIAALVMVVSQAAGIEILDAYTVRKVLPRLLFAAVFIALSWDILEFLVSLSNDAGNGMRGLIYAPFKDLADQGGSIAGGSLFALTLIGTGAALAFGWIGLLSFVVTGLLASLVAAAVLILRKMLILLIIMLSPFAIAASVLPNTRKIYDTWKSALTAVLIVFPIIMSFIAIGRVFSTVAFHSPGNATVNQLIAIVAYFAPYFLITMAFRMAGGVVAAVGGVVNDRSKGAFDRLKGFRGNKVNENMSKMGQGQRFQGSNPLARGFNATTFGAATLAKSNIKGAVMNPFSYITASGRNRARMAWGAAAGQRRNLNAMAYGKSDAGRGSAFNDSTMRAQTYANAAEAQANMERDFGMDARSVERAVAAARANGGFGRNQQVNAVNGLFRTGTGFDNLRQATESIYRVAGNNEEIAMSLIGNGNAVSGDNGRVDLNITFGHHAQLYHSMVQNGGVTNAEINEGYMSAIRNNDARSLVTGKPRAAQNLMPVLQSSLETARRVATDPGAGYNADGESLQDLAKQEAGRLTGIMEQVSGSAERYASPIIRESTQAAASGTVDLQQDVRQEASIYETDRNPATGDLEIRTVQNPANPGDPNDQVPVYKVPDANTAEGYNEQRDPYRRG